MMAGQWEDVAAFLLRRKYVAWQGWADAMLREVGMTSQYSPDDLAAVCRDDPTLEKPLGSAFALRTFLGYARRERMGGMERPPPAPRAREAPGGERPGIAGRAYATTLGAIEDM